MPLPDFLVIGVPKAGTTALHAALALHPQISMSRVKEPKYFLRDGPYAVACRGPGDAHSRREWITDRTEYEQLFDGPPGGLRGESTPFYLYDRSAHRSIHELIPSAKLVVVLRDPIDRAYSNWLHLWADGLETEVDFVKACALEEERRRAGWGPFWHYLGLGRYGEQLRDLRVLFPAAQVHVLRYRDLIDTASETLDRICRFIGVETGHVFAIPPENTRGFVPDSPRRRVLATAIRTGARLGAHLPPRLWRTASAPLLGALQRGAGPRPVLRPQDRLQLLEGFQDDIALLESVTGQSFADWMRDVGRGEFRNRRDLEGAAGDPGSGTQTDSTA